MSKQVFMILIIALATFTSQCTTNKSKIIEKINKLETEINASYPNPNPLQIKELHDLYLEYAKNYAKDTISPHFIYKAAESAVNTQQYDEAINNLDLLINNYPNHLLVPYSIFFKGFIYENFLNDKINAEKQYRFLISNYKEHPLSNQAIFSIESLQMSDKEIVERLELD